MKTDLVEEDAERLFESLREIRAQVLLLPFFDSDVSIVFHAIYIAEDAMKTQPPFPKSTLMNRFRIDLSFIMDIAGNGFGEESLDEW